jgi:hypothetical protein
MKKFYVEAAKGAARVLFDIHRTLDRGTSEIGSGEWPEPLWIVCSDKDADTVRELLQESGLTITREV